MADPDKQSLPMPDFDHLPLATLQHCIRSLDLDGLEQVAEYECGHGNRAPVLTVVEAPAGPKQNPPSQGVPSNPAQPRHTG